MSENNKIEIADKAIARNQKVRPVKVEQSRNLRTEQTPAENEFWDMVRKKKMHGLKFRRQQVIDGFIVDFYCGSIGLCVEIDGSVHNTVDQKKYDQLRDEAIALRGLSILRISNDDVLYNKDKVVELIMEHVNSARK